MAIESLILQAFLRLMPTNPHNLHEFPTFWLLPMLGRLHEQHWAVYLLVVSVFVVVANFGQSTSSLTVVMGLKDQSNP